MADVGQVAIDENREIDLRGVVLEDVGGEIGLVRDGVEIDANYLVLHTEVEEAVGYMPAPVYEEQYPPQEYYQQSSPPDEDIYNSRGIVPKGERKPENTDPPQE